MQPIIVCQDQKCKWVVSLDSSPQVGESYLKGYPCASLFRVSAIVVGPLGGHGPPNPPLLGLIIGRHQGHPSGFEENWEGAVGEV